MKNKHVILLIIIGLILLLFGVLSPLFLNKPAQNDLYNFDKYINVAQSFSGYMMPFIALLGALLTFAAFYIQYKANERIREQFDLEQSNAHFYRMLDIHINNVKEFSIESFYTDKKSQKKRNDIDIGQIIKDKAFQKYIEETITENIFSKTKSGRSCFVLMLKDLHFTIEMVLQENEKLSDSLDNEMLLKIAYRIFFWGTNSPHKYPIALDELSKKQIEEIDTINENLHHIRYNLRKYKGRSFPFKYSINEKVKTPIYFRFIPMSGHSTRLAHYYRHLYQTAKHIYKTSNHQKEEFVESDKIDLRFATLRAQMSNEEQLLFYYNYRIGFGSKWDKRYDSEEEGSDKYLFLSKYKMIHNIPLYDTIHHLVENPEKHFETYTDKYPDADLFEWS